MCAEWVLLSECDRCIVSTAEKKSNTTINVENIKVSSHLIRTISSLSLLAAAAETPRAYSQALARGCWVHSGERVYSRCGSLSRVGVVLWSEFGF